MLVEAGDDRWLADVGFGNDGMIAPIKFEENTEQQQFAHTYRLVAHPTFGYALQKKREDEYQTLFAFNLEACSPEDFLMSNYFTSTFPASFFLTMRMCTKPTKEGRITLTDNHFKTVKGNETIERPIADENEFTALVKEHFGLDLASIKS
jgi:N-hydroxyarylamine O-acetyltransferase